MANGATNPTTAAASLEELVAFNEQLASLIRAGIPLDQGLFDFGNRATGRSRELLALVASRIQSGESLASVVSDPSGVFPGAWKAMVLAGLRSGRLPSVLEGMAAAGRRMSETRRRLATTLIYPLFVAGLAYAAFILVTIAWAPGLQGAALSLTGEPDPWLQGLVWLGQVASWWVAWPPLILASLLMMEWRSSRWFTGQARGPLTRLLDCFVPHLDRARRDGHLARWVDVLSLLIREEVPLPEALELSAATCGDERLRLAAARLAASLRAGRACEPSDWAGLDLPPLLGAILSGAESNRGLADALAAAADRYRERSVAMSDELEVVLPIALSTFVGGTATLAIGLLVFSPVYRLLERLGTGG